MRVLLVEDDPMVGEAVREGLQRAGFSIDWVRDGRAAGLALSDPGVYQAAILDLNLPREDGMSVLRSLRARDTSLPVLIASARDDVADRIGGLDAGADDYLLKPFDLDELIARVRALLRRFAGSASPVFRSGGLDAGADDYLLKPFDLDELIARVRALLRRFAGSASPVFRSGGLELDPVRRTVTRDREPVSLSAREFAILEKLMLRPGAVVSRQQLEDSVYAWSGEVSSNAIEVHLHNLRRKLGSESIVNVRGVGYRVAR